MEYIDKIVNIFITTMGGLNFLSMIGAVLIILSILIAIISPLEA
jgi:hypothetical protein